MARWKEKEKPITFDEAMQIAKTTLEPYWYRSKPLFAAFAPREQDAVQGQSIYPLEEGFKDKTWIMLLLDPTEVTRKQTFVYLLELYRRYGMLDLGFMVILRSNYSLFSEREPVEKLLKRNQIPFICVVDYNGAICEALRVKEFPSLVMLSQGKTALECGPKDILGAESKIQEVLRRTDPGLALLRPWKSPESVRLAAGRIEFGTKLQPVFPPPGVTVTGKWKREEERIFTDDDGSSLTFQIPEGADGFSIIGQSLARHNESSSLHLDLDTFPIDSTRAGPDLSYDPEGRSRVQLQTFGLYHAAVQLTPGQTVTLKCIDATKSKVALFGIRFSAAHHS